MLAPNGLSGHEVLALHHKVLAPMPPNPGAAIHSGGAVHLAAALHNLWRSHLFPPAGAPMVSDIYTEAVRNTDTGSIGLAYRLRRNGLMEDQHLLFAPDAHTTQEAMHALQRRAIALLAAVLEPTRHVEMDARYVHHRFPLPTKCSLNCIRFAWNR